MGSKHVHVTATHRENIISDDITMHTVVTRTEVKCGVKIDRIRCCDDVIPCDSCRAAVEPLSHAELTFVLLVRESFPLLFDASDCDES